jgi:hypothetical protein
MEGHNGPSMRTPIYYVGLACSVVFWVLWPRAPPERPEHLLWPRLGSWRQSTSDHVPSPMTVGRRARGEYLRGDETGISDYSLHTPS